MGGLVAVMLPFRSHVDIAIVALVLVVPVVAGVVLGGFRAGVLAVVAGFLAYDVLFIPPYGTLTVGRAENWAPLGVYAIVMLLVSRVVDRLWQAEALSRQGQRDTARLLELSELLVSDRPLEQLTGIVVTEVKEAFGLRAVVLLLPEESPEGPDSPMGVVAEAGRPLAPAELALVTPAGGVTSSLRPAALRPAGPAGKAGPDEIESVVLSVGDRPAGILGVVGPGLPHHRRELLGAFANHVALAIERTRLRDQAVRVGVLEQVDRQRRSLLGAVSHDLRTPLATIKAAATALLDSSLELEPPEQSELAALIETQSDRLERVVANLLDLSRIEAGAIALELETVSVEALLAAALEGVGPAAAGIRLEVAPGTPPVEIDRVLTVEALVNLIENALRYSPAGLPVTLAAFPKEGASGVVRVTVGDLGPGIPAAERERVFGLFETSREPSEPVSGGTGLGLAIAKAFLTAEGAAISIDSSPAPGTRMLVDLRAAVPPSPPEARPPAPGRAAALAPGRR